MCIFFVTVVLLSTAHTMGSCTSTPRAQHRDEGEETKRASVFSRDMRSNHAATKELQKELAEAIPDGMVVQHILQSPDSGRFFVPALVVQLDDIRSGPLSPSMILKVTGQAPSPHSVPAIMASKSSTREEHSWFPWPPRGPLHVAIQIMCRSHKFRVGVQLQEALPWTLHRFAVVGEDAVANVTTVLLDLWRQYISCLHAMHTTTGFLHNDVGPNNLGFRGSVDAPEAVLIDFDRASAMQQPDGSPSRVEDLASLQFASIRQHGPYTCTELGMHAAMDFESLCYTMMWCLRGTPRSHLWMDIPHLHHMEEPNCEFAICQEKKACAPMLLRGGHFTTPSLTQHMANGIADMLEMVWALFDSQPEGEPLPASCVTDLRAAVALI